MFEFLEKHADKSNLIFFLLLYSQQHHIEGKSVHAYTEINIQLIVKKVQTAVDLVSKTRQK